MSIWRQLVRGLRTLTNRRATDQDIADEVQSYLEQAAESFQQVITAKPDDAEGYYNLGTLNLRKNDFKQSRQYLQQT